MKPMTPPSVSIADTWSRSYFCTMIGAVSEAAIRHSIEAWKGAFVQIPAYPTRAQVDVLGGMPRDL
jgi:hypothetical protein